MNFGVSPVVYETKQRIFTLNALALHLKQQQRQQQIYHKRIISEKESKTAIFDTIQN